MPSKKITSSDVAKLAGVSQASVSLILNNTSGVSFSQGTKDKVLDAARKLGYCLPAQKDNSTGKNIIAVFIPTLSNLFYPQLCAHIEKFSLQNNHKVIICNTSRDKNLEAYYLEYFAHAKVSGIIFTYVPNYPKLVEQISLSLPIVLIGEKNKDLTIPSIELSNIRAGSIMTEHLLSLGHQHFAFLTTPLENLSLARTQRLEGVKQALAKKGLEHNLDVLTTDSFVETERFDVPYEYDVGYNLTKQLLQNNSPATALIGVNDMTALGIISSLHELNYKVPEDFSVCGFDNLFISKIFIPSITTIEHHLSLRSQSAVEIIISKNKKETNNLPGYLTEQVNRIEYQPQLIAKASTGPVKHC